MDAACCQLEFCKTCPRTLTESGPAVPKLQPNQANSQVNHKTGGVEVFHEPSISNKTIFKSYCFNKELLKHKFKII